MQKKDLRKQKEKFRNFAIKSQGMIKILIFDVTHQ